MSAWSGLGFRLRRSRKGWDERHALSELVNEKSAVSAEMAIRLSKAFGSSRETWLEMQAANDLWEARERASQLRVTRLASASAKADL